jgi:ElaB/YqjD/DUF883 family membrane-anchored ribosome-binding protein
MTSTNNEAGGVRSAMTTGATTAAKDLDEIRTDIERTRGDLGDTVEALSAKTDVEARASEAVDEAKARASEAVDEAKARASEAASEAKARTADKARQVADTARRRPVPFAAVLAAIGTAVATGMLIRRRRNKARAANRWWKKSR